MFEPLTWSLLTIELWRPKHELGRTASVQYRCYRLEVGRKGEDTGATSTGDSPS